MPSRVEKLSSKATAVAIQGDAPIRVSKIPSALRFPLIVTLSLTLSSLLHSFAAEYTARDLAIVSRSLDQWWQVGTLVGWRAIALGVGWYGNYDSYDLVSLSFLSQGPPLYLLSTFYGVRFSTVATSLAIDALTTYVPFRLLRPLSLAHSASTSSRSVVVPNREVVTDYTVQAITTLLAASIYSVTLYTAYASYLPIYLVTYFEGISSITAAHSASPISLMPITLLLGLAAKSFIFTPAVVAVPSLADAKGSAFNPATATLAETFWHNIGGYNTRTKTVVKRTLSMMLVTGINTFVQTFFTIEGVEIVGAAAYSGIFVIAGGITGIALGLVGAV